MSSLDDLEATSKTVVEGEVFEVDDTEEDIMRQDILDAIGLLSKCMRLLDYMSDVDLCKSVAARERTNMANVADKVREFLGEAEPLYEAEV